MSELLLDFGNSRLKAALLENALVNYIGSIDTDATHAWHESLGQLVPHPPGIIWLASVSSSPRTQSLIQFCESQWETEVKLISIGDFLKHLPTRYVASQLGVDRWLAMLGCHVPNGTASLVVDAGTALTLDVVSAAGEHQGGYILPGLRSMHEALVGATSLSPILDEELVIEDGLARDTATAVQLGPLRALAALIHEMLATHPEPIELFIGGGDARYIHAILSQPYTKVDQMVLQGLSRLVQLEKS